MQRGAWAHAHDVGELRALEDDDGSHELRDARDRPLAAGVAAREHGAVVADEVPRRGRDLRLGSLGVGTRRLHGQREGEESDDGEQVALRITGGRTIGRHHPAAAHTCVASRSASAPAAARQSASESRYA